MLTHNGHVTSECDAEELQLLYRDQSQG